MVDFLIVYLEYAQFVVRTNEILIKNNKLLFFLRTYNLTWQYF